MLIAMHQLAKNSLLKTFHKQKNRLGYPRKIIEVFLQFTEGLIKWFESL